MTVAERISERICKTQKMLYRYAVEAGYDAKRFSDVFMRSDFCALHFDTDYSPYQTEFPAALFEIVYPEIEKDLLPPATKDDDEMFFAEDVGYTYRRIYHTTSIPSRQLSTLIPYEEIRARLNDDPDWFEQGHQGVVGIIESIIKDHSLPRKPYTEQS